VNPGQINEGKVVEAEGLLCRILEKAPPHAKLGAYVARGTARALARNLQRAHCGNVNPPNVLLRDMVQSATKAQPSY
jgi:hypothetical protein